MTRVRLGQAGVLMITLGLLFAGPVAYAIGAVLCLAASGTFDRSERSD